MVTRPPGGAEGGLSDRAGRATSRSLGMIAAGGDVGTPSLPLPDVATIRPAVVADLAALPHIEVRAGLPFRSIGLDAIADDPPPNADELFSHVSAGAAWVAEVDGEIVGYVLASVVDDEGHIDQMSVVPEMQGRGIGQALMQAVLGWSEREGYSSVTLTTFVDVPWNGPWYERRGFRFLRSDELGPELQAIRDGERASGLDIRPRAAMRRLRVRGSDR